jgi:hypothetical protein
MARLDPDKLHVSYLPGVTADEFSLPRRYTLTHSDRTGDLFLSVGGHYDTSRTSKLYTRLMRDEVLAEFVRPDGDLEFRVYCHVSGGLAVGPAAWRYRIFRTELPLVLEAMRYGDRVLFEQNHGLDDVPVTVLFQSANRRFNKAERWGTPFDFAQ